MYLPILNINLRFVADEVLVDIPAGIEDGQTVRLRIDGEQEVLVQVRVEDGGNLRREGYHVHSDLWIDIWDAAFGKTVTIPGLHGNINIKIPKEINSHTLLVLPERGFQVIYIFLLASFDLTFTQCNYGSYYTLLIMLVFVNQSLHFSNSKPSHHSPYFNEFLH